LKPAFGSAFFVAQPYSVFVATHLALVPALVAQLCSVFVAAHLALDKADFPSC